MWSLAIEEQFYLVWPPLLVLGLRYCKRTHLMALVLAAAMLSSLLMGLLYQPDADPSRVYFGTDTRAGGLLTGAALAFIQAPGRAVRALRQLVVAQRNRPDGAWRPGILGFRLSDAESMLYRGGFALVDLLTVALLAVIVDPRANFMGGLLGRPAAALDGIALVRHLPVALAGVRAQPDRSWMCPWMAGHCWPAGWR